jgi:hypothetical protein
MTAEKPNENIACVSENENESDGGRSLKAGCNFQRCFPEGRDCANPLCLRQ